MICPHCQHKNDENAKYCESCGAPLTAAAAAIPAPTKEKGFVSFLKGLFYFAVFFSIQSAVIYAYTFVVTFGTMFSSGILTGENFEEIYADMFAQVMNLLTDNIHSLLLLSGLLTVLVLCISFRVRRKSPLVEMHVRPVKPLFALLALLFGVALQAVIVITLSLLPLPQHIIDSFNANGELLTSGPILLQILNVAILTPIVEEITFRGLLFTRFRRGMKTGLAVVLSAIVFGAAHGSLLGFAYASLLGLFFALLMLRHDGSVLTPIFCHMGFNGASFLMQLVPEHQLIVFAIYFAAIAAALLLGFLLFKKPKGHSHETL